MTTPTGPQPGDFALVRKFDRIGLLLWLAQFADGSEPGDDEYHHAFIYIGEGEIVEAMPGGAVKSPLSKYDPSTLMWSTGLIDLSPPQRNTIVAYAESYVGTPYGWKVYLALAMSRFHLRFKWVKNTMASTDEMICSQYVDVCYRAGQEDMFPAELPGDITPAKLAMLLHRLSLRRLRKL